MSTLPPPGEAPNLRIVPDDLIWAAQERLGVECPKVDPFSDVERARAHLVERIFKCCAAGVNPSVIAQMLIDEGVIAPNSGGAQ